MDLKKLIDPKTRYVFFAQGVEVHACPVVHVDSNFLYFSSQKLLSEQYDLGYFLAQSGAGIVQFDHPSVDQLKKSENVSETPHLYRMNTQDLDYSIINRRRSFRYEFKEFVPVAFNVFGEFMAARLMNISEGGLRMCIDTPINKDILCHLQIKIPDQCDEIRLNTDGVVVYADHNEDSKKIMVGISFVTPDFSSDQDRQTYLTAQKRLKEFVMEKEDKKAES